MMAPLSPAASAFRVAGQKDHAVCVGMLRDLVDELGPSANDKDIKAALGVDIQRALASDSVRIILCDIGGKDVALARGDILFDSPIFRLRPQTKCGYVDQLYVVPRYRGLGLGKKLLAQIEQWFVSCELTHALLHAAPHAMAFYTRLGFANNREMFKRLR